MRGYPPPDFSTTAWYNRPFACADGPWQAVSWQVCGRGHATRLRWTCPAFRSIVGLLPLLTHCATLSLLDARLLFPSLGYGRPSATS